MLNGSANNNIISGNSFTSNGATSLISVSTSNNVITANRLVDAGGSANNNAIAITGGSSNTIANNSITDASCTTTCYAISITSGSTNYLAGNNLGGGTINDAGTGTIYAGQAIAASGGDILFKQGNSTTALEVQNSSGTAILSVNTTNGRVGIGATAPSYALDVTGSQASTYIARINNTNTTNTADGLLINLGVANGSRGTGNYFVGFAGAGTVAGKIQGGASAVAYTTTAADYAEYFRADSTDLPEAAELVILDQGRDQAVLRSEGGSTAPLAGVVSTNPGFVGNGPLCDIDDDDCDANYAKYNSLVALSGQVPTKVNASHGPISIGDPITSSNVAGQGAKATSTGYIVGYALEPLSGGSGTIKVLIRPQFYTAPVSSALQGTGLTVSGNATISGVLTVNNTLNVTGMANLQGGTVVSGTLTANSSLLVKGSASFQGNVTIVGKLNTSDIYVNGHIMTTGDTPAATIGAALGEGVFGDSTSNPTIVNDGTDGSGTITITAGAQNVGDGVLAHVVFSKAYDGAFNATISPLNKESSDINVYITKNADGFDVMASEPLSPGVEYSFSYVVLGVKQ